MDATKRTESNYRRWRTHLMKALGDSYKPGFAHQQWMLYWHGIRDVRLHDAAVYLIDNYGY